MADGWQVFAYKKLQTVGAGLCRELHPVDAEALLGVTQARPPWSPAETDLT